MIHLNSFTNDNDDQSISAVHKQGLSQKFFKGGGGGSDSSRGVGFIFSYILGGVQNYFPYKFQSLQGVPPWLRPCTQAYHYEFCVPSRQRVMK